MTTLAFNKKANFDYTISDTYEAGLVLHGYEVKAVRAGHVNLKGAFVTIKQGNKFPELYLTNCHISLYSKASTIEHYNPERPRKLLLKRAEISKLIGKKQEHGLTFVPLKLYTTHNRVKLEFGVGKGKKKYDKREDIKKKDIDRQIRTLTKLHKA